MNNIKEHLIGSRERKNLEMVASMLRYISEVDVHTKNTYFDFGQDWKWTTLIAGRGRDSYQMLNPKQMDMICNSNTLDELLDIAYILYNEQHDLLERRTAC